MALPRFYANAGSEGTDTVKGLPDGSHFQRGAQAETRASEMNGQLP